MLGKHRYNMDTFGKLDNIIFIDGVSINILTALNLMKYIKTYKHIIIMHITNTRLVLLC